MIDIIKIDGISYPNVAISEFSENFTILYSENTGRTVAVGGRMVLDPLGTFIAHNVTFVCKNGHEDEFDQLYNYLYQPRYNGMNIDIIHLQTRLNYEAYVSQGEREVRRIDPNTGKVYYNRFSVNIIPMEAQVKPL